ncbi:MAG: hypothetical protein FD124_2042 [Alphaproteobacteria bacterium]|nr:MAG: hypothetical protein FD160_1347 [Caulobacteraceae bacterium]TPW05712.1 MAG: hypothetical protein FD124_2042 [Alphaproteobacteria bacterium]
MIAPDPAARAAFAKGVLALAADRPWREVTIFDIAKAAETDIASLAGLAPSDASDILDDHFDRAAAQGVTSIDTTQGLRDRLFDLAMRRFEAMEPHRFAIIALDRTQDGLGQAQAFARAGRTARWLLTLAGETVDGVDGAAKVQGLAVVLTRAHAAWKNDADGDFTRTMAALDKGLRDAETWAERLGLKTRTKEGG